VLSIASVAGGSGAGGAFRAGDTIAVTFSAKKNDGSSWTASELSDGHVLVSGPTFNYQRVIADQSDLLTAARANADGTYTYTFATRFPSVYLAPYHDSAAFGALDGELQGQPLLDGTYSVGIYCHWNYTVGRRAVRGRRAGDQGLPLRRRGDGHGARGREDRQLQSLPQHGAGARRRAEDGAALRPMPHFRRRGRQRATASRSTSA
jgi:hypothetical protein